MEVRIVDLAPMRVASAYGFGLSPEEDAWASMRTWAAPKGLLDDLQARRLYGFNNPYPTPQSPRYGYEMWLEVDPGVEPSSNIRIVEFLGGKFAVCRCDVAGRPELIIPSSWKSLATWCASNGHELAQHPALERYLSPPIDLRALILELHCPIRS